MTADDQSKAPPPHEVRFSPKFKRTERRRQFRGGLLCLVLACVPFIDALLSIRRHEWVDLGSASNHFFVPPWVAIAMGLLLVFLGAWAMYISVGREKKP
jgi:protein-S-isoprenylcysteine O-methyltransferase Ste14